MRNLLSIVLTASSLLFSTRLAAQETGKGDPAATVAALTREYRFDEALDVLQRQLDASRENPSASIRLDDELRRARLGADMLRGTERVVFVDSVVVPRSELLARYRLGAGCSLLTDAHAYAPAGRRSGAVACVNDFGDRAMAALADSTGTLRLHALFRLGGEWADEGSLALSADTAGVQDFPFLLQDGVTLYYAAQGPESLGGYDIFVTRYDTEEKRFLRPENLGMPFNSPANDYLFALDETRQIGLFATDRAQPADSVCIYYFIPTDSRDVYDYEAEPDRVRRLAALTSMAETQTDTAAVLAARNRLATSPSLQPASADGDGATAFRIILDDNRVCTSPDELSTPQARRIAAGWAARKQELDRAGTTLDTLRRRYATAKPAERKALAPDILRLEQQADELEASLATMEQNIRRAEGIGK